MIAHFCWQGQVSQYRDFPRSGRAKAHQGRPCHSTALAGRTGRVTERSTYHFLNKGPAQLPLLSDLTLIWYSHCAYGTLGILNLIFISSAPAVSDWSRGSAHGDDVIAQAGTWGSPGVLVHVETCCSCSQCKTKGLEEGQPGLSPTGLCRSRNAAAGFHSTWRGQKPLQKGAVEIADLCLKGL